MRVLAVKMEENLFDELKAHVKKSGLTMQQYVNTTLERDIHSQAQTQTQDNQPKVWEKDEVEKAIDAFISQNGRVPRQTEFKNENGLPSYKAAARCLDSSPAQYAQRRMDETGIAEQEQEAEDFSMSM